MTHLDLGSVNVDDVIFPQVLVRGEEIVQEKDSLCLYAHVGVFYTMTDDIDTVTLSKHGLSSWKVSDHAGHGEKALDLEACGSETNLEVDVKGLSNEEHVVLG